MFDYPIKSPRIWGSCNGLLCLTERDDNYRVCLWNPFTKEYKDLPPPLPLTTEMIPIGITKVSDNIITYGFGYDRFIEDYKIIRCEGRLGDGTNDSDDYSIIEFQVYTLQTNTWRKISTDNNHFVLPSLHVFLNGALHWIMSTSEVKLASFDIEKDVFQEILTPCFASEIQVVRGCLCVLEFDWNKESCCNVWMMMDYGLKESWTKLFTIVQKEVESLHQNIMPYYYYTLLTFCENGEILIGTILIGGDDILFVYDPTNNKARRVELGEIGKYFFQSEIYIESLVSLNSGVYIESDRAH